MSLPLDKSIFARRVGVAVTRFHVGSGWKLSNHRRLCAQLSHDVTPVSHRFQTKAVLPRLA